MIIVKTDRLLVRRLEELCLLIQINRNCSVIYLICYRKGYRKAEGITFAAALRMAWANAKTYNEAKAAAGAAEITHTWAGWKNLGYEVIHESKALFKAVLLDPTTKKGTRITAYFGESQVQPLGA